MSTIWTLTVDDDGMVVTTVHASEAAGLAALRVNFDPTGGLAQVPDADLIEALIDQQRLVIYLVEHETPAPLPPEPTMVRISTRETRAGGNDISVTELEDAAGLTLAAAGSLDALVDAALEGDPGLYDYLAKYNEVVESDRTAQFIRDGE